MAQLSFRLRSHHRNHCFFPGKDLTLEAVVQHPSGVINKLEFFNKGQSLGDGTLSGTDMYNLKLQEVKRGNYSITVMALDGSGIPTISGPVEFRIGEPPQVVISPTNSATFFGTGNLDLVATAKSAGGTIVRVDFYDDDRLIGSNAGFDDAKFVFTWRYVPEGEHVLKAIAVDDLGASVTSTPVKIRVVRAKRSNK